MEITKWHELGEIGAFVENAPNERFSHKATLVPSKNFNPQS